MRRPVPAWLAARPGWSRAVCATVGWAWYGHGAQPVVIEPATASSPPPAYSRSTAPAASAARAAAARVSSSRQRASWGGAALVGSALSFGVFAALDLGECSLGSADRGGGFVGGGDSDLVLATRALLLGGALADIAWRELDVIWVDSVVGVVSVGFPLGDDIGELVLVGDLAIIVVASLVGSLVRSVIRLRRTVPVAALFGRLEVICRSAARPVARSAASRSGLLSHASPLVVSSRWSSRARRWLSSSWARSAAARVWPYQRARASATSRSCSTRRSSTSAGSGRGARTAAALTNRPPATRLSSCTTLLAMRA